MKKILSVSIIPLLILIVVQPIYGIAEDTNFPKWISELHSKISQTFKIQVTNSHIKQPDRLEKNKYFLFCLQGEGSLEKVPDPFKEIDKLFFSEGWKINERYQADGHGASSFAYEKENYFCNIFINTDSSCNDEETGHVPSKFWFEIYCREK
jgi:hypothetical protein